MKLMVSQNAPFVPMYNAWREDSRDMLHYDDDKARRDVEIIDAKVLSNRKPPYSIAGKENMEIIMKEGNKINKYTPSEQQGSGAKGKRVGIAYELENGEIIYVPE